MLKVRKKDAPQKFNIPLRKSKNISCIYCQRTFNIKDAYRIEGSNCPLLRYCGHTICDKCSEDSKALSCPKCNDNSTSHTPSINFYAVGLMLAQNSRPAGIPSITDEEFVFSKSMTSKIHQSTQYCIECKEAATSRCIGCVHLYCDECFRKIHSCHILRDHEKVPLANIDHMPPQLATVCEKHTSNTVKYWCTQCSVRCCTDCVIHEHRAHPTIEIQEMNELCHDEFTAAYEGLADIIGQVYIAKKEVDAALKFPEKTLNCAKAESEINQHFLYLHGILQNLECQMIDMLHAQIRGQSRNLIEIQEELQSLETTLQDGILLASLAKRKSESVNHMEIIKQLKELANVRCYLLKRQVNDEDKESIKFHADESVVSAIRNHCIVNTKPSPKLYSLVASNELPDDYVIKTIERESLSIPSLDASSPICPVSSSNDPAAENCAVSISSSSPIDTGMLARKEYEVHVSYICNPYCFYIRKKSDNHLYEDIVSELKKNDTIPDLFPEKVIEGEIYAIHGKQHQWYRGRVETFREYETTRVYNTFAIDDGFIYKVDKSKIRCLPSKLIDIPPLATKHKLYDIYPINGETWSRESIEEMRKIVNNATEELPTLYEVGDVEKGVDLLIPTLLHNDAWSLRDALLFLGHGKFESTEKLLNLNPSASNVYHHDQLELHKYHEIVCLHVDSPKCFHVRKADYNEEYFQKMVLEMTKVYKSTKKVRSIIYNPVIGLNCAAPYNGSWYRGVISNIPGNRKIEVLLVDLGVKCVMDYDKIRRLDPCFTRATTRAIKLRLENAEDIDEQPNTNRIMIEHMDPTAKIIISAKIDDDYYIASVLDRHNMSLKYFLNANRDHEDENPSSSTEKSLGKAPIKSKSKLKFKRNDNKRHYYYPQALMDFCPDTTKGNTDVKLQPEQDPYLCRVNIIHVVSPDEIYIATADRVGTLNEIHNKMQNFYTKRKSTGSPDISPGAMCAVRLPHNGAYYRAEIIEISEGNVKVFCVDDGKYETIPENCIQSLAPELFAIPAFLYRVKLGGILPTCGMSTWTSVPCEKLVEIITCNETRNFFIAKTDDSIDGPMTVDLYVEEVKINNPVAPPVVERIVINRVLVEEGLALPIKGYNDTKLKVLAADVEKQMNFHDENLNELLYEETSSNVDTPKKSEDFINDPPKDMSKHFPPDIKSWLPAESIKENSFLAMTTYVDWDASVCLHSVKQIAALSEIEKKLADNYSYEKVCETDEWSPGDMCIVKYHATDKWCRGVVHQVGEEYISVEFVDYGNFEWQKRDDLSKELMLEDVPRIASKCQIYGLISNSPNGIWDSAALRILHATIVDKKCTVTILRRNKGYNIIKMNCVEGIKRDLIAYLYYDKQMNLSLEDMNLEMNSDVASNSSADINTQFYENLNDDGDSANVFIQDANDDYTHRNAEYDVESNDYLDKSIEYLVTAGSTDVSSEVSSMVKTTVGTVIKNDLIPDERAIICENFDEFEAKSVTNGSHGDNSSYTDEDYFESNGKICHALLPGAYHSLLADFQLPSNDGKYKQLILPDDITEFEGAVGEIDVHEPNIVWLHPSMTKNCSILNFYHDAYTKLHIEMYQEAGEQPYLENVDTGTPCCAIYEGNWYRCSIVSPVILSGMIEVLYVDWGNIELVEVNQIHVMKKEWFDLPTLAIKCRLWNTRTADNVRARNWLQFKRDNSRESYRIEVVDRELDHVIVKIFEKDKDDRLMYQDLIDRQIFLENLHDLY